MTGHWRTLILVARIFLAFIRGVIHTEEETAKKIALFRMKHIIALARENIRTKKAWE